jgi:hypothetical protein
LARSTFSAADESDLGAIRLAEELNKIPLAPFVIGFRFPLNAKQLTRQMLATRAWH